jgi:hypothetical protein
MWEMSRRNRHMEDRQIIDYAEFNGYSKVKISFHNHRKRGAWKSEDYIPDVTPWYGVIRFVCF